MILSDLHFGKTGHFRKAGIAVPTHVYKEDLQRLISQIQYFNPAQLIIVGDLFHSKANRELDFFKKWRQDFQQLQIKLVKGNHDILTSDYYNAFDIEVTEKIWHCDPFIFCHDCNDIEPHEDTYIFSGHLHPGVRMVGKARQALQFPCYYFTKYYCVLPAFSKFTGLALIRPQKKEKVFVIAGDHVFGL